MAEVTITIPDALLSRVADGFAGYYGYQDTITDPGTGAQVPNPQTKAQHMRERVIEHVKAVVGDHERAAAAEEAQGAVADIDGIA
jgi:hypothetical protein